ncbi:hypothetical protein QFC22_005875 [Naganishia vaughanmartiniae]|uniref:Uncharacterized protein n=1 Tax=Naganishia vaughanmartiniae TaxID=1424756 RepID=A0ACC2WQJ7_9TREE|nr:hypothetical protein QFC22_005875 [Naganishia vaughanmartiniae]
MSIFRTSTLVRSSRTLAVLRPQILTGTRAIQTSSVWRNAASSETGEGQVDIRGKLKEALKAAMKGKEKDVVGCIRSLMADITYHEKAGANPNEPASEDTVVDVLRKAVDKRSQAAGSYPQDHPSHQQFLSEIALISKFLPRTLSVEQITQILEGIVTGLTQADKTSKGATGQVLKQFWEVVKKGEVQDKKALGKIIGEMLRK